MKQRAGDSSREPQPAPRLRDWCPEESHPNVRFAPESGHVRRN